MSVLNRGGRSKIGRYHLNILNMFCWAFSISLSDFPGEEFRGVDWAGLGVF